MTLAQLTLIEAFKAILSTGKTVNNLSSCKSQFLAAVKITRQEGEIEFINNITEQFVSRLQVKNSWGKNQVVKELEVAILEANKTSA